MYLFILDTSGFVAFVVGGNVHKEVELYSPEGNCQHSLAPIPVSGSESYEPVLAFTDEKILACGGSGNKNCYLYHTKNDSWSVYSTSSFTQNLQPGETFNEKIYITDGSNPEVFDPASNSWSSWPKPIRKTGNGPCLVAWMDTFILLGGFSNRQGIQTFNHSSNTWQVLDSTNVPMDIYLSGCALLSSDEILVVGSEDSDLSSAALYNIRANTWKKLAETTNAKQGASLVILGSRIFVMGDHYENVIEEFDYDTSTWSLVEAKLITHREGHQGVIALPAEMFQHLPGGCVGVQ
jgi:N-acetylneuraminic acid mutarotase